jgi:hypothetical protein
MTARYTGFIQKAPDGQGIVGVLRDFCGWPIAITGKPGEQDGVRGYVIEGVLGEPPAALRLPIIDLMPAGEAPK